ncbi:MAG: DUF1761 domain-containing protein [Gammaproteobacteria bacterium]|nr:DUF1761 domain-containing protein [Gammaproteobacteria bacterium]
MEVNYLAVVAAALSSFLLGGLWYSPLLFLRPWNAAMGRDDASPDGHPVRVFGLSFLFALVSAFVFAILLGPAPELWPAIQLGVTIAIGFIAMSFGINYQFANRPMSALFIDGGYHVGQFVLYGVILGLWH